MILERFAQKNSARIEIEFCTGASQLSSFFTVLQTNWRGSVRPVVQGRRWIVRVGGYCRSDMVVLSLTASPHFFCDRDEVRSHAKIMLEALILLQQLGCAHRNIKRKFTVSFGLFTFARNWYSLTNSVIILQPRFSSFQGLMSWENYACQISPLDTSQIILTN